MRRSALFLMIFVVAACKPPSAADDDGGDAAVVVDGAATVDAASPSYDADPSLGPERSCETHFVYVPTGTATVVELVGEWDWNTREPMQAQAGRFTLSKSLAPGVYAYKFVVDGNWLFDPDNGYRKYDGGVENSGMRVPDCRDPDLVLGTFSVSGATASARIDFLRGAGGAAADPAALTVTLAHDFAAAPATFAYVDHQIAIDLASLAPGKYTLVVAAADLDGRAAKLLRLPFWVEAEVFDWRDAIIYMLMTDRFSDGDDSNNPGVTPGAESSADWYGGDLAGITAAIEADYFDQLGVRAIWLSPFARNPVGAHTEGGHGVTGYHGYWPISGRELDPRLGTAADLEAMVRAAHAHGIRILMDFVINHVHEDHEYYQAHPEWFRTGCECGSPGCDWTEHRLDCLFHDYMPDVNWEKPEVAEAMIGDALWWLERFDLDGLRVDAVKHVEDLAIFNLSTRVHEEFERAGTEYFLLGETAMGWAGHSIEDNLSEYGTISRYIGPWGLNGQFDFVLYHAVSYNVFAYDTYGLIHADYWTRASLDHYPADAIMTPYIGSHDTQRLLSLADPAAASVVYNKWPDQGLPVAPAAAEPYQRLGVGLAWTLTLPGAPLLYYGDEYGEFGASDPDNRHMWRAIGERSAAEDALFAMVSKIGGARRASPALRRGGYSTLLAEDSVLAYARHTASELAIVILNHGDAPATRTLTIPATLPAPPTTFTNALDPTGPTIAVSGGELSVTVPARSAAILLP